MKKILFLLIPINIFCQATKVSELPVATTATDNSFTIMNVGGTPDTTKRITTSNLWNYFLYKDTATNILATRYWVSNTSLTDDILDYVCGKYRPYPTGGAKGTIYRGGVDPSNGDSTVGYQGNFEVYSLNSTTNITALGEYSSIQGSIGKFGNFFPSDNNARFSIYSTDGLSNIGLLITTYDTDTALRINHTEPNGVIVDFITSTGTKGFQVQHNGNMFAEALESNLGKYELTMNSSTKEIYAKQLAHAYLSFEDANFAITCVNLDTWYQVTSGTGIFEFTSDVYVDSLANDTMQLKETAHWKFDYHINAQGLSGTTFQLRLYNVTKARALKAKAVNTMMGAGNIMTIGGDAYCSFCELNDKIILQVNCKSNNKDIDIYDGSIYVEATHGTQ